MKRKILAIHQPDFMPWMGFFLKASRVDVFVVLDHVRNNPREGSWFRRVRVAANGKPTWISIPLAHPKENTFVRIDEMTISTTETHLMRKYVATLQQGYARTPFFRPFFPLVQAYFDAETQSLRDRNMRFVRDVFGLLGIGPTVLYSSEMGCVAAGTELLVEIAQKTSATTYLSGDGASGYLDETLFERHGIELAFNQFMPIPYRQVNTPSFLPGLSVLDALMNVGADEVKRMLSSLRGA